MKILVTGAAGFIGSHVVDELEERGVEVDVCDDLSNGHRSNLPPKQRKQIDNRFPVSWLKESDIDGHEAVIHCAALASVSGTSAGRAIDNVADVAHLATLCKEANASLIYTSSAAVYGSHNGNAEESMRVWPQSPYGASKASGEAFIQAIYPEGTFVVRLFNVFGPRQRNNGALVPALMDAALRNGKFFREGDGLAVRQLVYVKDVARFLTHAAIHEWPLRGPVNFADPAGETTVNQAIEAVQNITGRAFDVEQREQRTGDIRTSRTNFTQFAALCTQYGYDPQFTSPTRALKETWDWFQSTLGGRVE